MSAARNPLKPLTNPIAKFFESIHEHESSESSDDESLFVEDKIDDNGTKFAKRENRGVNIWRFLVALMLLAAGATTSILTYVILNDEEKEDFHVSVSAFLILCADIDFSEARSSTFGYFFAHQYNLFVQNFQDSSSVQMRDSHLAFESLSESITSEAIANGEKFPFVTVSGFEIKGEYLRRLSGIEMLAYTPVVDRNQMQEWVAYTFQNQGWIQESRKIVTQGDKDVISSSTYLEGNVTPVVYQHDPEFFPQTVEIVATTSPLLPFWQVCLLLFSKLAWSTRQLTIPVLLVVCL